MSNTTPDLSYAIVLLEQGVALVMADTPAPAMTDWATEAARYLQAVNGGS